MPIKADGSDALEVVIDAVRVGVVRPLPPEGQPSAIDKQDVIGPVRITRLGLNGDEHGDPRVHGGPEKALHYFSAEGYARLAQTLPVPVPVGCLGENLRGSGATEVSVCVGDIYRVGTALVQVSRPRTPCWKIDNVLRHEGANLILARLRCQGWYLRVLQEGHVSAGEHMALVERPNPHATLDRVLSIQQELRPPTDELRELADAEGLDDTIRRRLLGRAKWLEDNT